MSNTNTPKATISVQPKNNDSIAPTTEQLNQAKTVIIAAPWMQDVSALFGLTVDQVDDLIQQTILNFGEITRLVYVAFAGDKETATQDIKALYGDMLPNLTLDQLKSNVMANGMLFVPKIRDWILSTFGQEAAEGFDEAFKQVFTKLSSMKEKKASLSDYAKEIGNRIVAHAPAQQQPAQQQQPAPTGHNNFRELMEELAKKHPQKPPVKIDPKQGDYIPAKSAPALAW